MITANLIDNGHIKVQIEYEVGSSGGKNYTIDGKAYLFNGWKSKGVVDRDFIVEFSSNWECETVMRFFGEDYEKEDFDIKDRGSIAYYQTGSVRDLVDMSRALFMIHYLLEMELTKTSTDMDEDDNKYAKSFNILDGCTIEYEYEQGGAKNETIL